MVEILRKTITNMSFDETVEHVQTIVASEGFTVLLTKAIDQVIEKKLGVKDYPRYTSIMACGADLAKAALDVHKDVGTLFPCSFVVYEEDSEIKVAHVSIMKIAAELGFTSHEAMAPVIKKTGERVSAAWDKI
ncbi:hypothetical protein CEE45_10315 [Candidatus Heimdallarchaeota archaeon B3_Heim]|nr:MAG: hypothetical protein CEE45_10315 [Candidatus Heimdallarchaeota archaeon B3_Heim]